jgi:hypothetical protein
MKEYSTELLFLLEPHIGFALHQTDMGTYIKQCITFAGTTSKSCKLLKSSLSYINWRVMISYSTMYARLNNEVMDLVYGRGERFYYRIPD